MHPKDLVILNTKEAPMQHKLNKSSNLEEFIKYLSTFKKSSVVEKGLKELWEKENLANGNFDGEVHSRIILLSLATDENNSEGKEPNFEQICEEYKDINEPKVIAQKLIQEIKKLNNDDEKKVKFPEGFLKEEIIQDALKAVESDKNYYPVTPKSGIFMESLATSRKLISDYARDYPEANTVVKNTLNMEPLAFLNSCLALFVWARGRIGYISLNDESYDETLAERMNINKETCMLAAHRLSIDEDELKRSWLDSEVLRKLELSEQKFFPNPLAKQPLIHMNKELRAGQLFIMPSPQYFLYAAQNYLFLTLGKNDEAFNAKFGKIIEKHICEALSNIFGNCEKIPKTKGKKSADFKITLSKSILIIELKTRIAPLAERSIMGYRNIAKMWIELYSTCKQLAGSIKECGDKQKCIIPIILFYDLFNLQHLSFRIFAERSGLFGELGINFLEIFNWSSFEDILSKTSKEKFEEKLLERAATADSLKIKKMKEDFIPEWDKNNQAHSYKYLEEYKILPKKEI